MVPAMTKEEYSKVVAANLRRLAYDHGKTQMDIAKDLGVNQATVSCWMNGRRTPKVDTIDRLCEYFNCIRDDIMEPYVPKPLPHLTKKEREVAYAYREAPDSIKDSILILLGLKERG